MKTDTEITSVSKAAAWSGRTMGLLTALFLLLDAFMKITKSEIAVQTTVELGYQENVVAGLGVVLLTCTVLYLIPKTSVLGAVLLTGYLGGVVATHLRVGAELFPISFPIMIGILLWGGLVLRDERLRSLFPIPE